LLFSRPIRTARFAGALRAIRQCVRQPKDCRTIEPVAVSRGCRLGIARDGRRIGVRPSSRARGAPSLRRARVPSGAAERNGGRPVPGRPTTTVRRRRAARLRARSRFGALLTDRRRSRPRRHVPGLAEGQEEREARDDDEPVAAPAPGSSGWSKGDRSKWIAVGVRSVSGLLPDPGWPINGVAVQAAVRD